MMELGQPMHAFDADTIEWHIIVRQARVGESVTALDGKTYDLIPDDIVIADTTKILAIAGVMWGLHTGISETTKNICVESAVFDAASIRQTAKRLSLTSDASMRFGKSLDPTFSPIALRRAVQFLEFAKVGGTLVGYSEYLNESPLRDSTLAFTHAQIEKSIGIKISENEILKTLSDLEFAPVKTQGVYDLLYPSNESSANQNIHQNVETIYEVVVPSHRATKDIKSTNDMIEEIARIHGYNHIDETPISWVLGIVPKNDDIVLRNSLQNYLVGCGFSEAWNAPFELATLSSDFFEFSGTVDRSESQDSKVLRSSLAPSLFRNARENLKVSSSVKFFEISKVFQKIDGVVAESRKLAGIISNGNISDVRASLDGLFAKLHVEVDIQQGSNLPFLHPNTSGTYVHGQDILGVFGSLHPNTLRDFELPATAWYFEMNLSELSSVIPTSQKYAPPSLFPGISRELNFLLDRTLSTGEVAKRISAVDPRIRSLSVADVYEHDKIGKDKKSVTFSFVIEDAFRPITDEDCQAVQNSIIEILEKQSIYLRR